MPMPRIRWYYKCMCQNTFNHKECHLTPLTCYRQLFVIAVQKYLLSVGWINHRGGVTHICVSKLTIIGSNNGLPPGRRQCIIWSNAGILLIRTWWTSFVSEIHTFSFTKMHLKMSSVKWQQFCLGLNVIMCSWYIPREPWIEMSGPSVLLWLSYE